MLPVHVCSELKENGLVTMDGGVLKEVENSVELVCIYQALVYLCLHVSHILHISVSVAVVGSYFKSGLGGVTW
jgi:hypothetical protein